ncbi:MAG: aminotransferase class V-fold PLP-dependent enzyme [Gemmatimonadetes bacterium]|nr:aminotransferase class V-fold PLP-dependent enzyme [Gemmatimonadota bacterium]
MKDVRELFPGASRRIYLDAGVTGLLPAPVRSAVERVLDDCTTGASVKDDLLAMVERTRARFAELIGADADEVAVTKNVSEGLNLFASSLPWERGDNVVLCPELEHPNNVYLWYNLRTLRGIEVREVAPDDGRVPVERMAAAIDRRTRVVTCPHISFSPGFITDLPLLTRAAHAHEALVLLDAAQSVGAIHCDVRTLGVDAMVTATQKSMLALYGIGFLWIRRSLAAQLTPAFVARYGIDLGAGAHETALGSTGGELVFKQGAKRFDLGNYNYVGIAAAEAALDLLLSLGVKEVEAHVRGLGARLADGLADAGLPVVGGRSGPHRAHIVAVGASGGGRHYTADDPRMNALYRHLGEHGVKLSIRQGVLRFGCGLWNNMADIDRVTELSRTFVA